MRQSQRLKIQYAGMTSSPDDYLAPDGELLTCIGLENSYGAKMSSRRHGPKELSRMSYHDGSLGGDTYVEFKVLYVHRMESKTIALLERTRTSATSSDKNVFSMDVTSGFPATMLAGHTKEITQLAGKTVKTVKNISDTLIVNDGTNVHYMLWKSGDTDTTSGYKYLGTHIPELPITFGLQTEYCHYWDNRGVKGNNTEDASDSDEEENSDLEYFFEFNKDKYYFDSTGVEYKYKFKDSDLTQVTSEIMAKVNRCIAEGHEKGYFMQPFLVRYAIEMYDGKTTMASAPVYMAVCHPKDGIAMPYPLMERDALSPNWVSRWYLDYAKSVMDYAADSTALAAIKEWKDVVKGVKIAVSAPMYTYDPSGKIKYLIGGEMGETYGPDTESFFYNISHNAVKTFAKEYVNTGLRTRSYSEQDARDFYDDDSDFYPHTYDKYQGNQAKPGYPYSLMQLPEKTQAEYDQQVKDCSLFYVVKTIALNDIQTTRTVLKYKKGVLSTITNQPVLDDEYNTHDEIQSDNMYVYNGRLNLCGVKRKIWNGFKAETLLPYQSVSTKTTKIVLEIEENGEKHVVSSAVSYLNQGKIGYYLYFPNTNVKKAYIDQLTDYQIDMEEHTGLNGSVVVGDLKNTTYTGTIPTVKNGTVTSTNKLYTSEALNPYVFLPSNINTMGNGKILGMAVAMKAISVGQAGQYPMYCMTDEGVWIMEPNQTGGWSAKQAIMSDVCTVPEAIVETDGAVIMPTSKGLMMLQGEQSVCITSNNTSSTSIKVSDLPKLADVLSNKWGFTTSSPDTDITVDIGEYIRSKNLRCLYDYKNDRVIYYRPDKDYSVVVDTGNEPHVCLQRWDIRSAPHTAEGCLVNVKVGDNMYLADLVGNVFTTYGNNELPMTMTRSALIITRPIKGTEIGVRDVRKQLDTIWHQGRYKKGSFDIMLYGTQDYKNWHLIGQAKDATGLYGHHGQHWMAFVVVIYVKNMQDSDVIDCADLTMTARLADKSSAITGYK